MCEVGDGNDGSTAAAAPDAKPAASAAPAQTTGPAFATGNETI